MKKISNSVESRYLDIFLAPLMKCKVYQPRFGNESSISLSEFTSQYSADPFYAWIGLNTKEMYAAHRAAGGITSIYRQIGIGCERLFRAILIDTTGYSNEEFATWGYSVKNHSGKVKKLSLDGRIELSQVTNQAVLEKVQQWISDYCENMGEVKKPSRGVVFEIRQGYKSKDSKRQNGDIDNATVAWANNYLPIFAIFSSQIDSSLVLRYQNNRCGILLGTTDNNPRTSLYAFCDQILGYDLAEFFNTHSDSIQKEIHNILRILLDS